MRRTDSPELRYAKSVLNVEYHRDVKPILERSCVACHTQKWDKPAGNLILDDGRPETHDGSNFPQAQLPNTSFRLAVDAKAHYGHKPPGTGTDGYSRGSRYVWPIQARRSLLALRAFESRLTARASFAFLSRTPHLNVVSGFPRNQGRFMDKLPVTARLRCVATEKRLLLDGSLPGQELSTRERTILTLLAQGYTNQQNADQFLSTKTVETYRSRIACSTAGRVDGRSRVKSSCFGNCSSLSGSPDYRPEAQVLYSVTFLTCGLALLAAAINQGGLTWLLVWPSISFLLVGLAYLILGPGVFGKRSDGRIAWWNGLLLLPFLMLTWAVWHLLRFVSREPACHQVAANLHVGRRLYPHEIPDGVTLIIDLTAEFSEPPAVLVGRSYRCLPTLDAQPPPAEGLRRLAEEAAAWPGGVLVHCANGHGRSATVAAAILLARGLAVDVRQAEALLRQKRPGIRLKPGQRQAVAAFISRTRTSFAAPAQS